MPGIIAMEFIKNDSVLMKGIFAAPASEETLINKETNGHFVPSRKNYL